AFRIRQDSPANRGLAEPGAFSYRGAVIGFLRSLGVLNAAIWLGAVVFYTFGAVPGLTCQAAQALLGPRNFGYFSVAMADLVTTRLFHLQLVCAVVAVLHLMAEWLYLGKVPQRLWRGVLTGVIA